MSAQFAMVLSHASTVPAGQDPDGVPGQGAAAGGLLSQAAAGPGFWEGLLGELRREGLIAALLADGVIAQAVAEAEHGHKLDRTLTAEVTALCVIVGALFPEQGYDLVLARTFGMPTASTVSIRQVSTGASAVLPKPTATALVSVLSPTGAVAATVTAKAPTGPVTNAAPSATRTAEPTASCHRMTISCRPFPVTVSSTRSPSLVSDQRR